MMKTSFDEAFAKQLSPRNLMPAEACSELGLKPARMPRPGWFARLMPALRRWLAGRHARAHG